MSAEIAATVAQEITARDPFNEEFVGMDLAGAGSDLATNVNLDLLPPLMGEWEADDPVDYGSADSGPVDCGEGNDHDSDSVGTLSPVDSVSADPVPVSESVLVSGSAFPDLPDLDHGQPVTLEDLPDSSSSPVPPPPADGTPVSMVAIGVEEMQAIAALNSGMEKIEGGVDLGESGESEEITEQRMKVSDLVLEITMLKARVKSLGKELEVEAELLQELVDEGPRSIPPAPKVEIKAPALEKGLPSSVSVTVEVDPIADPGIAKSPSANRRIGNPPDPAGDKLLESVFKISKGVLEKLNEQDVKTVRHLEKFMQEGMFVPGRTKGIGEAAIEKITDQYCTYRMANPVPNWEDWEAQQREKAAKEADQAEKDKADHPLVEIQFDSTEARPAEVRVSVTTDDPQFEAAVIDAAKKAFGPVIHPESEPEASPATPEVHPDTAPIPTAKKPAPATTPDGTLADPLAYHAGHKAAQEMESVSANPHKPNSHLWHSWDRGWQDGN